MHLLINFFSPEKLWTPTLLLCLIIVIGKIWVNHLREHPMDDPEFTINRGASFEILNFVIMFILFAFSFTIPFRYSILFVIGSVLYFSGVIGLIVTLREFTRKKRGLLRKGLFKLSRNPLYVSIHFSIVGLNLLGFCLSWQYITFAIVSFAWIIHTHYIILAEEEFLIHKYKDPYEEYMTRVKRYLFF